MERFVDEAVQRTKPALLMAKAFSRLPEKRDEALQFAFPRMATTHLSDSRSASTTRAFWEANYYEPNPNNPVIFHIRKKNSWRTGKTRNGKIGGQGTNGTPVHSDLLNGGRVSADGQLEISAVTNTEKYPPRIFNWRAAILSARAAA